MNKPLVQITDESGTVVGVTSMPEAFKSELIRHTVYVMVVDTDGRYLLQKRSNKVPNYKNYWEASAGGHIDEGETPDVAAYRELEEELGLQDMALHHAARFYFESEGDGRTYRYYAHAYVGRLPADAKLDYNPDEIEAVQFFSPSEVGQLEKVTPITRHIIDLL